MTLRLVLVLLLACLVSRAVIIDRIAIVVGNSIVKDSDIERDIRVTDFLNSEPLNLSLSSRKTAADRLIDQVFIRSEIRLGDYPTATAQQADQELDQLVKQKFRTASSLDSALGKYGLSDLDLRSQFQWQLTVLKFVDARFKAAAFVSDQEIDKYYKEHVRDLRREHPTNYSLNDTRKEITDVLSGQQVNQLFFSWLDEQRKASKIQYLEESLR